MFKRSLLAATFLVGAGFTTSGHAADVMSGNDKVSLTLSGHVNRAVVFANDGHATDVYFVDNDSNNSTVTLDAAGSFGDNYKIGAIWQFQMASNNSSDISQRTENTDPSTNGFTQKVIDVYLENPTWGKLWLGQGWTASEDVAEVDLTGTGNGSYSDLNSFGGSMLFKPTNVTTCTGTANRCNGLAVSNFYNNIDGLGRTDRVRYDTPNFMGLQAQVGATQGANYDVALVYAASYPDVGLDVAASAAYVNQASTNNTFDKAAAGSISILHKSGFGVTVSGGSQFANASGRDDHTNIYTKLGYQSKASKIGATYLSVQFGQSENLAANGDEFKAFGVAIAQDIDAVGGQIYAGWHRYELERTGSTTYEDIDFSMVGMQLTF